MCEVEEFRCMDQGRCLSVETGHCSGAGRGGCVKAEQRAAASDLPLGWQWVDLAHSGDRPPGDWSRVNRWQVGGDRF